MTKKDHEDFINSSKCCICKKAYEEVKVKVKEHDGITRNYQKFLNEECSLNLSLSKKVLVVFYNLKNYD